MTQTRANMSRRRSTGLLTGRLLERRVPLRGTITNQLASCCIARLLVLATEDRQKPIITYIDSPGGSVAEALSVISTMNGIRSPVVTFSRGAIGGAAAVIAAHGLKGFRTADPAAHFSLGIKNETSGDESAELHESYLKLLVQILVNDTSKSEAEVLRWLTQGVEFNAQEAMHNGLIDAIALDPLLPIVS